MTAIVSVPEVTDVCFLQNLGGMPWRIAWNPLRFPLHAKLLTRDTPARLRNRHTQAFVRCDRGQQSRRPIPRQSKAAGSVGTSSAAPNKKLFGAGANHAMRTRLSPYAFL
jgi:hypothetical protein